MFKYLFKRLIWFIPTLFIVTLFGFFLLSNTPTDPVDILTKNTELSSAINNTDAQKKYWQKKLGLDLPLFYFSVNRLSEPDTLYKLTDKQRIKHYKRLIDITGNYASVNFFYKSLQHCKHTFSTLVIRDTKDTTFSKNNTELIIRSLDALEYQTDFEIQNYHLQNIKTAIHFYTNDVQVIFNPLFEAAQQLKTNTSIYKNYLPKFAWYGVNNRYHHWLFGGDYSKGIIRGDFGISYVKKEPVIFILKDKLIWSLFFSITSIILAYLISIPIGIKIAQKPYQTWSKVSQVILFMLYSMPSFFIGVLLLMLFANPDILSILPPSGVKPIGGYSDNSLFSNIIESLPYIILPLICYTYSSLAYISKLTTTSITEQLKLDYIRTAKAKGLTDKQVIWRHALKNSLIPIITIFSSVFPGVIGGSIIIETIFTIPGMGLEIEKAVMANDYPIVVAIITLSTILTMLSYLIADVLYALVDPRIRDRKLITNN